MRRQDSGWRDASLTKRLAGYGFTAPAAGMSLPFIEYDRGQPVAIISYQHRGTELPRGADVGAAHRALGNLHRKNGEPLPFFTAQYDVRNWAFRLLGHNAAATKFLGHTGWAEMTENQFCASLYALRGRHAPVLAAYGVDFGTSPWIASEPSQDWSVPGLPPESWQGQHMSRRRRNYEPVEQTRATWRNPCLDIDQAVVAPDDRVALVVDYKAPGARINLTSTNMQALSGLYVQEGRDLTEVPAMVVSYEQGENHWFYSVHCLNKYARHHLSYVLGQKSDVQTFAQAIAGDEWVSLSEQQWIDVLSCARDL